MNREDSLICLADALSRMLQDDTRGRTILEELPSDLHQDAQDVVVYVWHFVDDARARRKDGAQKEDQEQQMRDLIDALRRGAPREVLLEYTML
jgi:hypothetical protein